MKTHETRFDPEGENPFPVVNLIKEYLEANDNQSLLGALLQYGFDPKAIDANEKSGVIEIRDSMVYLIEEPIIDDRILECEGCGRTGPGDQLSHNNLCPDCVKEWIG